MNITSIVWCCCAAMTLGIICGCETVVVPPAPKNDARQVDPAGPFFGRPEDVTMYSLESSARQLIADMKANAEFRRYYEMKKTAKKTTRPTVIVGDIQNSTTKRIFHRLVTVRDTVVRPELLNTGLFTIMSEDAESAPDYAVHGEFREVPESDGRYNHYLYIRIKDVHSGAKIWEGVRKNVKL